MKPGVTFIRRKKQRIQRKERWSPLFILFPVNVVFTIPKDTSKSACLESKNYEEQDRLSAAIP